MLSRRNRKQAGVSIAAACLISGTGMVPGGGCSSSRRKVGLILSYLHKWCCRSNSGCQRHGQTLVIFAGKLISPIRSMHH